MTEPDRPEYDDEEQLRKLYWDEELSQREIGERYGVSDVAICRAMARYGIETRPRGYGAGREKQYTDEELLEWIDSFVEAVGVVPTAPDMRECPGPSANTYRNRFGSWKAAVRAAGHTPRGEQQ